MKTRLLITLIVLFVKGLSQVSTIYTWTQANVPYSSISGGILLGSTTSDDQYFVDPANPLGGFTTTGVGFPIGFNFIYNYTSYDRIGINNNGWITFGQSSLSPSVNMQTSSAYSPISATSTAPSALQNRVAAVGRDLQSQTGGSLRIETIGTAPNRVCVIEWANYKKYNQTGDNYNFQIRLYETTMVIETVYGTFANGTVSGTVQVGLRGTLNTDYNNRTTTSNWAATTAGTSNSSSCTISSTVFPLSSLVFRWTPPAVDMSALTFISPSQSPVCFSGNQTVTVQIRNNGTATMNYASTPVTVSSSVTGPNPVTFPNVVISSGTLAPNTTQNVTITTTYNMTASGTYTFNANTSVSGDGNASNNASPPYPVVNTGVLPVTATATPPSYCVTGTSQLMGCSPTVVQIGTGTVSNTSTTYPAPYGNWFWGSRHQMLILASELTAQGIGAGDISSLAFDVVSNSGAALVNFTISLGTTSLNSITSFQPGTTQVYTIPSYMPVPGWNTHTFQTPYVWNGTSNLIVEVCHNNTSFTSNAVVRQTTGSFSSTVYYRADANGVCANNSITGTSFQRPNMKLNACGGGTPGNTWTWTPATNLSSTTINNPVASPSSTTTYSVTLTNTTGCTGSASVTVTVDPYPTVTVTAVNNSICNNTSTSITASGANAYTWAPSAGLSATTGATVTANPSVTSTYTITGTSPAGCSNTSTITITVNPAPTVALGSDIVQCPGNITLNAGNPGSSYLWSTGGTGQQEIVNATGSYSVIVTDGNGCNGYDTINVTINPSPVVALGQDITQCGGTVLLDAQNQGATYQWNDGSTFQQFLATTSGTYSVVVTDMNGCSGSDAINVVINSVPVVALGNDTTRCGGTVTLDAGNPGASYAWSQSSTTQMITVSSSGIYSVLVTDGNGCTNSDTINVTINAVPVVALGPDITQCGDTVWLDAGNPGSAYSWNTGATTQIIGVTVSGVYAVTVTSPQGCTNSDAILVVFNPVPIVALGADVTQCGGTVLIDAQNSGATYLWNTGATTQMITVSTSGTYDVQVTNSYGCTDSDTINITINPLPNANAGPDVTICSGDSVMLSGNGPFSSYLWTDNVVSYNAQSVVVYPGQTTSYYYTVTDANGCANSDTMIVIIEVIPTASFTYAIVTPGTINFTNTSMTPPFNSVWDFGDGSPLSNSTSPTHIYTANGTYNVILTVSNQCGATTFSQNIIVGGVGIGEITGLAGLNVYPSPTTGMLNLVIDNSNVDEFNVQITDITGQLIHAMNGKAGGMKVNEQIDLSGAANGIYFLKVNAGGVQQTLRFVISR
jgi:hypothetical protein